MVIFQSNRYGPGNKVGPPAVQSLTDTVVTRSADHGIVVTTSPFTAPAVKRADSARVPLTLIDGDEITRLAVEAASSAEVGVKPSPVGGPMIQTLKRPFTIYCSSHALAARLCGI